MEKTEESTIEDYTLCSTNMPAAYQIIYKLNEAYNGIFLHHITLQCLNRLKD